MSINTGGKTSELLATCLLFLQDLLSYFVLVFFHSFTRISLQIYV